MRDLIGFVLRGACGGAAITAGLAILLYGARGDFFLLSPAYFVLTLLPGAVVGLFLWFIAGRGDQPLTAGLRFSMGTAFAGGYFVVASLAQVALTLDASRLSDFDVPFMITVMAAYAVSIGGPAGLLCPAGREDVHRKREMTYRERARLYEAAEEEARAARVRNASSRVIT